MDDLSLDFTRYLSQRLGVSDEQAADLLGAWLKDYEPVSCGQSTPPGRRGADAPAQDALQHSA